MRKKIGAFLLAFTVIVIWVRNFSAKNKALDGKAQVMAYNKVLSQWALKKIDAEYLQNYFKRRRIEKIAIYGTGTLGEVFYRTMVGNSVNIVAFIDKNAGSEKLNIEGIPVCNLEMVADIEEVDAVIVTPVYNLQEIEEELLSNGIKAKKTISMEHIVEGR